MNIKFITFTDAILCSYDYHHYVLQMFNMNVIVNLFVSCDNFTILTTVVQTIVLTIGELRNPAVNNQNVMLQCLS